jgi:hypothetical protein
MVQRRSNEAPSLSRIDSKVSVHFGFRGNAVLGKLAHDSELFPPLPRAFGSTSDGAQFPLRRPFFKRCAAGLLQSLAQVSVVSAGFPITQKSNVSTRWSQTRSGCAPRPIASNTRRRLRMPCEYCQQMGQTPSSKPEDFELTGKLLHRDQYFAQLFSSGRVTGNLRGTATELLFLNRIL